MAGQRSSNACDITTNNSEWILALSRLCDVCVFVCVCVSSGGGGAGGGGWMKVAEP